MDYILNKMTVHQVAMYREHMNFHISGERKIYEAEGPQRIS